MSLSDEERQKFEDNFKYLVSKYIEFLSLYNQLLCKTIRTPEEEQEFQAVQQLLLSIGEVLSTTLKSLGDDLFGKALDLYYHYKEVATTGDKDAQDFITELKPLFAASLKSRINMN